MAAGFFHKTALKVIERPQFHTAQCQKCGLKDTCNSPMMPPSGKGKRNILVVAEAPGETEDRAGKQLVGNSGVEVERVFRTHGIDMRRDCTLTNALICRPPDNKIPNNRVVGYCRPNLIQTVKEVDPEIIVLLGATACESLLGWLWKDEIGGIGRWAGYRIPDQKINAWVCPTFHPAHLLRVKDRVLDRLFSEHLEAVSELRGRPWRTVPDFRKDVQIVTSPNEAADMVARIKPGSTVAFDFETNMLKPDSAKAEIICCSLCWEGKRTIAFPWHGRVLREMEALLGNPKISKVGWNVKFEDRWCRENGITVRGWKWDGMLAAHAIDNGGKGRAVTGLKFQAYVNYGLADYNGVVHEFLKAKGGNRENRVREVDLSTLLLYCGLDSLLEYKICDRQMRGVDEGND